MTQPDPAQSRSPVSARPAPEAFLCPEDDPTMDEIWANLIDQAKERTACASDEALCHVHAYVGPAYARLTHSMPGTDPHACEVCPPGDPQHFVSIHSLQTVKRDALVARVARFFTHCHAESSQGAELRAA